MACGGESSGDGDAGDDGDADGGDADDDAGGSQEVCPADVHARFQVYVLDDLPAVLGEYDDRPGTGLGLETEDGCRISTILDDDGGGGCDPGGPDGNVYRSAFAEYVPGAEVGVSGGGDASGVEPFAIDVVAVPQLTAESTSYTVAQGEDLVITWDQADSPAGTRIGLYAATSGEDTDVIECWWATPDRRRCRPRSSTRSFPGWTRSTSSPSPASTTQPPRPSAAAPLCRPGPDSASTSAGRPRGRETGA